MDKMAPEKVSNNSGTLKLDARKEAQQALFKYGANTLSWKKSYMWSKGVHFPFPLSLN